MKVVWLNFAFLYSCAVQAGKKFKKRPSTQAEARDCEATLSPDQLSSVLCSAKVRGAMMSYDSFSALFSWSYRFIFILLMHNHGTQRVWLCI